MRNHGLCEMRASKTAHPRWCSKERLYSNRNVYVMRQLIYHSDLMREPCLIGTAGTGASAGFSVSSTLRNA